MRGDPSWQMSTTTSWAAKGTKETKNFVNLSPKPSCSSIFVPGSHHVHFFIQPRIYPLKFGVRFAENIKNFRAERSKTLNPTPATWAKMPCHVFLQCMDVRVWCEGIDLLLCHPTQGLFLQYSQVRLRPQAPSTSTNAM